MKNTLFCALLALAASTAMAADEAVTLKITAKDGQFTPNLLQAPPGKPLRLEVSNASNRAVEFESSDLRKERVIPAGGQTVIEVVALHPGQYGFYDDFNPAGGKGVLLVK